MATPSEILENALQRASTTIHKSSIKDISILERISYVARCLGNRAGARMLMTCALAKIHQPSVDIRKPYTEIGDTDTFSGRAEYDEKHVWPFASKYQLPVNSTTAFLTPGFRTINVALTPSLTISGRPKQMYVDTIQLLDDVFQNRISAENLLIETVRQLLILKQEQDDRMTQLLKELRTTAHGIPLSSEEIVVLIEQHLSSPKTSRLPVLIVTSAYRTAEHLLGEKARPLFAHNAADLQTGAMGDIEITLTDEGNVVTCYEMKAKQIVQSDIDLALQKIVSSGKQIDNYIFITTDKIDPDVTSYASSLYRETGGIEFAILDCIGFLRHFLHLFHRIRHQFLETYQEFILAEPDSAVSQPLKEVFLALRRAAEIDSSNH
ncbi:MAG: restriction endonuclease, SacI family [Chloroflexi bacterium]|nr:MAG: restriction endonuclease, SacI family [Chloroflexota bacterium]